MSIKKPTLCPYETELIEFTEESLGIKYMGYMRPSDFIDAHYCSAKMRYAKLRKKEWNKNETKSKSRKRSVWTKQKRFNG